MGVGHKRIGAKICVLNRKDRHPHSGIVSACDPMSDVRHVRFPAPCEGRI